MIGGPPPMMGRFFFHTKGQIFNQLVYQTTKKINYPEYPGHCRITSVYFENSYFIFGSEAVLVGIWEFEVPN